MAEERHTNLGHEVEDAVEEHVHRCSARDDERPPPPVVILQHRRQTVSNAFHLFQWRTSVEKSGVRVSQVRPSNCFRLHHTSMISKHATIPVPDSS